VREGLAKGETVENRNANDNRRTARVAGWEQSCGATDYLIAAYGF
jgi:hypothetical protein